MKEKNNLSLWESIKYMLYDIDLESFIYGLIGIGAAAALFAAAFLIVQIALHIE